MATKASGPRPPSFVTGWRAQPATLQILRAFLGVTFVYAGIQKFLDPNFFHQGSIGYIAPHLQELAIGSPIAPLLRLAEHFPIITGIGIALLELAIGLATLLGVAPIATAAAAFGVNRPLTLSASWHIHPYFPGSDSIYAV